MVSFVFSPGVFRGSPSTIAFDSNIVNSSNNSEESVFTKMRAPGVSNSPVFDSIFDAKTDHRNVMNEINISSCVIENSTGVVFQSIWNSNTTGDRASLVDFLHHGFFSFDMAIFIRLIDFVIISNEASFSRRTVLADSHVRTFLSVVMSSSSVDGTSLIGNFVFGHPFKSIKSFSSVTSVVSTAGN